MCIGFFYTVRTNCHVFAPSLHRPTGAIILLPSQQQPAKSKMPPTRLRTPKHKTHSSLLKRNAKGEIAQWDANSTDGRELKIYMENGCCANLTASGIKEKFVQFKAYDHKTFSGACQRARTTHNKQVGDRNIGPTVTGCEFLFLVLVDCCLALSMVYL